MKVWVGDPCYVLTDSQMDQVRDRWDPEVDVDETFTAVVYDTHCGDGRFYDQFGNEYLVDSGMLAVIPECCIREDRLDTHYPSCGNTHDDEDWANFFVDDHSRSDTGLIRFGHVRIETGPLEEDE